MRHSAIAVALSIAAAASIASAQAVSGVVRSQQDGAAVAGAIVALTRDTTRVIATLTGDKGEFRLAAPAPGAYGLRVDVVGFRSEFVPAFDVTLNGATRDVSFPFEHVSLPAIAVTASSRCERVAGESGDAARLWNEAQKTLEATRIAQDEKRFVVTLTRFDRVLALPDSSVRQTQSTTQSGVSSNPFVSLTPDSVARAGYRGVLAGKEVYYAPDARVLLSNQFVSGHCFGTRRDGPLGTVGLSFRPATAPVVVRGKARTDIEGVMWLDSASAELRSLDYRYRPGPGSGGTVAFGKLPNGMWGVEHWVIRMPMLEIHESQIRPDGAVGRFVDTLVTGVEEEGGQVLAGVNERAVATAVRGTVVRGTVFDSTRLAPVAGAVVTLEGAGRTVRSADDGSFIIDSLGDGGTFRLRFWHPRLDSLGIGMPRVTVRVLRGEQTTVNLAVPAAGTIARARCGKEPIESVRMIAGVVRDDQGKPAGDVDVVALERIPESGALGATEFRLVARTTVASDSGRYALCDVPVGPSAASALWLVARNGGVWSTPRPVALADSVTANVVDLVVTSDSVTDAARKGQVFVLGRVKTGGDAGRVDGLVLFPGEPPSAGVQVLVNGRVATVAREDGLFRLERVAEGDKVVTFRSSVGTANVGVHAVRGESVVLLVTLRPAATTTVASAGSTPELEGWRSGFEKRRARGQGTFLDKAAIERKGAQSMADLLRGVPGVKVIPDGAGYRYTSSHGGVSFMDDSPGDCEMMFYVDGHPFQVDPGQVDTQIRAADIQALEVYVSATNVPREFAGYKSSCGVVVVWRSG